MPRAVERDQWHACRLHESLPASQERVWVDNGPIGLRHRPRGLFADPAVRAERRTEGESLRTPLGLPLTEQCCRRIIEPDKPGLEIDVGPCEPQQLASP